MSRDATAHVTAEELHLIVAEASRSGVLEEYERSIISGVVRLADRPVREVMTPRTEVDWLDVGMDADAVKIALLDSGHTRLPVAEGSIDAVIGDRSEEHTSELQSLMRLSYAGFCLTKKTQHNIRHGS